MIYILVHSFAWILKKWVLPFTYLNQTRYLGIKESMQPSAAAINANDMTWTDFANLWPNFQPKMKILAGQLAKQSPKSTIFRSRMRRRGEVEMLEWITNKVRISLYRLVRFYIFFSKSHNHALDFNWDKVLDLYFRLCMRLAMFQGAVLIFVWWAGTFMLGCFKFGFGF